MTCLESFLAAEMTWLYRKVTTVHIIVAAIKTLKQRMNKAYFDHRNSAIAKIGYMQKIIKSIYEHGRKLLKS